MVARCWLLPSIWFFPRTGAGIQLPIHCAAGSGNDLLREAKLAESAGLSRGWRSSSRFLVSDHVKSAAARAKDRYLQPKKAGTALGAPAAYFTLLSYSFLSI